MAELLWEGCQAAGVFLDAHAVNLGQVELDLTTRLHEEGIEEDAVVSLVRATQEGGQTERLQRLVDRLHPEEDQGCKCALS